ncbi:pseudouridine synthase [Mesomycoplasma molare]|uniref:Pseudouridine synthase n=1 Tax=Mesomycoplasma molare TaxID=171288 RepID=A0ABY5TXW3_9BACT|nr:pseudouridine synthase [Mesomycoplasma molare]UWD34406.1 rRNA pseudouridine synthase [Mesomycoplasma molare]
MKQRIEKILSENSDYSRSEIKKLINNKKVKVNGKIITKSVLIENIENIEIMINDQIVKIKEKFIYILLNKPQNYVCANKDNLHKIVFELLDKEILKYKNLHTIGRLDKDTEGLLIITNDGEITHNLLSPKKHVSKTYYVELDNEIPTNLIEKFKEGFWINEYEKVLPSELEILNKNSSHLTIREGKFHQVKRMFAKFNLKVLFLKRISFNNLLLPDDLKIGEYIQITKKDLL